MFAIGLHYLHGWAMASADGPAKQRAEWPPHPERVFSAFAAAFFESDQDPSERAALEWLEQLPPPGLVASDHVPRTAVVHFVPVNDAVVGRVHDLPSDLKSLRTSGLDVVPEHRSRQARTWPVAIPVDPHVTLVWPDAEAGVHRPALDALCARVTHVGHSASLVLARVEETPAPATLLPTRGPATCRLRVPGPGRLDYLERSCNHDAVVAWADLSAAIEAQRAAVKRSRGKAKKALQATLDDLEARLVRDFPAGAPSSRRPEPGLWQGYTRPQPPVQAPPASSHFDPRLVVLSVRGPRIGLETTLQVTDALRNTLLKACPLPIPEWVSGHTADGRPSQAPHVAVLPLPFVGSAHADGHLLGLALALPRDVDPAEAARVLEPLLFDDQGLPGVIRLFDGRWFECEASLEERETPPWNLRAEAWTGPADRWATVTPVVLDRHHDGPDRWRHAEDTVAEACAHVGLPRPEEVTLHDTSLFAGAPRSPDLPRIRRRRDGGGMHQVHAVLRFPTAVSGPVLLGAGRYRGYGLCRPAPTGGRSC